MADIMKKTQHKMTLVFLIVNGFGSLNMPLDSFLSSKSASVITFSFSCIVKQLSAWLHVFTLTVTHWVIAFFSISFNLDVRKKF